MIAPVRPGDVIADKYRVERVLGAGGMGVVVAATHLELGDLVALKFLLPEAAERPETTQRFLREAQAAVRIRSEHVARISDVGRLATGAPYLVMEHLSGANLAEVLARRGPLPEPLLAAWVLQACEAIAEAHALGIVHRDLKPANLFLTQRADGSDLVKVLDFGISKQLDTPSGQSLTATHGALGSPSYMSPEQVWSAKNVDARADVWALGVILHELASGRLPFEEETATACVAAIVTKEPVALRSHAPHVDPRLESIVLRCLARDIGERLPDVASLAELLAVLAPEEARVSLERIRRLAGPRREEGPATIDPTSAPPSLAPSVPVETPATLVSGAPSESGATDRGLARSTERVAPRRAWPAWTWTLAGAATMALGGTLWTRTRAPLPAAAPIASPSSSASAPAPAASSSAATLGPIAPAHLVGKQVFQPSFLTLVGNKLYGVERVENGQVWELPVPRAHETYVTPLFRGEHPRGFAVAGSRAVWANGVSYHGTMGIGPLEGGKARTVAADLLFNNSMTANERYAVIVNGGTWTREDVYQNDGNVVRVDLDTGAVGTIASAQMSPFEVTLNGDEAIWLCGDGSIHRAPIAGGANKLVVFSQKIASSSIAASGGFVYWGDLSRDAIVRSSLATTNHVEVVVPDVHRPTAIQLVDGRLFWAASGVIATRALEGGATTIVARDQEAVLSIAVGERDVYWGLATSTVWTAPWRAPEGHGG